MGADEDLEEIIDLIIVDDDPIARNLAKIRAENPVFTEGPGYNLRVRTFGTCTEAYHYLKKRHDAGKILPRGYLLDMNFPNEATIGGQPATDLCEYIQSIDKDGIISFFTGHYSPPDEAMVARTGVPAIVKRIVKGSMETNLALDIFFREIARKKEMTQVVNRNSIGREYEFEVSPSGTYRIATPPSGSRVPRTTPQNRTSKETYHGPPCRYIATATTSLP